MYGGGGTTQMADFPAALASLQHLDIDELKEILNNEDKFDTFVAELPQIKSLQLEKEVLMTSNKSLAEYNLSQEPVVRAEKEKLLERFQTATRLAEQIKLMKADIDSKSGKMSPESLLVLLEAANQETEEESETMLELFISNGGSLDEFLQQYKDKRKLAHLRRIKIDKMRELLNAKRQPQVTPARPAPPIPGQTSGQNSFLPYPTSAAAGYPTLPGPAYPPVSQPGYPALPGYPARPAYGVPAYPPHSNTSYRLPTPPFR